MLSVVIPCYNEEKNIPLIIERLVFVIKDRLDIEIILVNNGSKDDTDKVMIQEIAKTGRKYFKIAKVFENQGYGYGILSGLKVASGDVLAWTHADMQTDPEDVLRAYDTYEQQSNECIFIKGNRKNRHFMEAFFTFGMQMIVFFFLKSYLSDINAQPKLFSRKFYSLYLSKDAPYDFSLDLYAMYQAKKNGYKILTIPVYFAKREYGEAKGGGGSWKNKIKLIKRTLKYILEFSDRIKNK